MEAPTPHIWAGQPLPEGSTRELLGVFTALMPIWVEVVMTTAGVFYAEGPNQGTEVQSLAASHQLLWSWERRARAFPTR